MGKGTKIAFYILLFGLLTFVAAAFRSPVKQPHSPTQVLGAADGLELFIQPEAGHNPVLAIIDSAQQEILVEVYLLSDKPIITALKDAADRGVTVKVMLEQHPFGGGSVNPATFAALASAGVAVTWTSPAFALTHEKAIIIDGRVVCILNQNLTTAAFTDNREYDVCDQNSQDATETKQIFNADWNRQDFFPTAPNLVVSPDNSREKLTALISSATESIDLEIEDLQDQKIVGLLAQKAKMLPVRVILPPANKIAGNLTVPGAQNRTLSAPYVHAKLLLIDSKRAYIGSVNLSTQSLDQNRELGILISQPDVIDRLVLTFENDWEKSVN
ncbi:MAG: phospholipase D-like domain-containing protein [Patescibacteria group bacterium]|nr:phospholipase D-like domain-containing protein [Patescibacteria group bacterium]MCL5431644.1 phospholipase D-like domain-containing protein [Patescibacteria group bacterium]